MVNYQSIGHNDLIPLVILVSSVLSKKKPSLVNWPWLFYPRNWVSLQVCQGFCEPVVEPHEGREAGEAEEQAEAAAQGADELVERHQEHHLLSTNLGKCKDDWF